MKEAASSMSSKDMESVALKAAKKMVKKQVKKQQKQKKTSDDDGLSLQDLASSVAQQISSSSSLNENIQVKTVQDWIRNSKKFQIDDEKRVSIRKKIKKKRKAGDDEDESDDDEDETKKKSPSKKAKLSSSASAEKMTKKTSKKKAEEEGEKSVSDWRKEHKITLLYSNHHGSSSSLPVLHEHADYFPFQTFESCQETLLPTLVQHCVETKGFTRPSPIQAQAWPILTAATTNDSSNKKKKPGKATGGRSVVGIAETGSGKTLAFALPALSAMARDDKNNGQRGRRLPRMLVLAPTRELASQSHVVLEEFGALVQLTSLVVYGGIPKQAQVSALRKGTVDCIVATPGRLKDLLSDGSCDLSQIKHLVLDEADRMLDMGFEEDVRQILSHCPKHTEGRNTCMFSATWPAAIQRIAKEYMMEPIIRIYVGFDAASVTPKENDNDDDVDGDGSAHGNAVIDDSLAANKRVKQIVEVIDDRDRQARLREILKQYHLYPSGRGGGGNNKKNEQQQNRVLVFALYKKEAERLEQWLQREGWNCNSIHGNKQQNARTAALDEFKSGTCPLLVATDVAARGLDIPNVELVINYTFPLTIEDYVHRIGRTARGGRIGTSITFFQPTDKAHAGSLQQVMKQAGQTVPEALMKFGSTIKKKEHKLYGNFGPRTGPGPVKQATKIKFDSSDDED